MRVSGVFNPTNYKAQLEIINIFLIAQLNTTQRTVYKLDIENVRTFSFNRARALEIYYVPVANAIRIRALIDIHRQDDQLFIDQLSIAIQ